MCIYTFILQVVITVESSREFGSADIVGIDQGFTPKTETRRIMLKLSRQDNICSDFFACFAFCFKIVKYVKNTIKSTIMHGTSLPLCRSDRYRKLQ